MAAQETDFLREQVRQILSDFKFKKSDKNVSSSKIHKHYNDYKFKNLINELIRLYKEQADDNSDADSDSDSQSSESKHSSKQIGSDCRSDYDSDSNHKNMIYKQEDLKHDDDLNRSVPVPDIGPIGPEDDIGPALIDFKPDANHKVETVDRAEYLDETIGLLKPEDKQNLQIKDDIEDTIMGIFGDSGKNKHKRKRNYNAIYLGAKDEDMNKPLYKNKQETDRRKLLDYCLI